MASALIGFTGFVGGNLAGKHRFDDLYNSKNIADIRGRTYDLLVCAGAPAEKWKANQDPAADAAALDLLKQPLSVARVAKCILISTVDVYPVPVGVDENTPIDPKAGSVYGRHRLELERFVRERFDTLVVRLPALFGTGLKKNVVYDLLHDNMLEAIHADAAFQFYGLDRLWADLQRFLDAGLGLINVATQPVSVHEMAAAAFGVNFTNRPQRSPACYDFRTIHAERFGGHGGYLLTKARVLADLKAFVESEQNR